MQEIRSRISCVVSIEGWKPLKPDYHTDVWKDWTLIKNVSHWKKTPSPPPLWNCLVSTKCMTIRSPAISCVVSMEVWKALEQDYHTRLLHEKFEKNSLLRKLDFNNGSWQNDLKRWDMRGESDRIFKGFVDVIVVGVSVTSMR